MSHPPYRYVGVTRNGEARLGVTTPSGTLAQWVEDRFAAGWRQLTVSPGPGPVPPVPGNGPPLVVAAITRHPDTGRRTWWAESEGTWPRKIR